MGAHTSVGQSIVRGFVYDASTQERLIGASISVIGNEIDAFTNIDGRFMIELDLSEAVTLKLTAKGYQSRSVTIYDTTLLSISLEHIFAQGYRNLTHHESINGPILNSDRNVDKIQGEELFSIANGQMIYGLGNYAGIFSYLTGLNNQTVGMRGFTQSSHDRLLTSVNGIDSRLPGFGSTLGGFSGPSEIDIESVELITGPSSAVFGDAAYQGSISILTKDPWNHSGLEARIYGGSESALDAQLRFAQPFGKDRKWAFNASAQFQRMDDRAASNQYGRHSSSFNLDSTLQDLGSQFNSDQLDLLGRFKTWLNDQGQGADPGQVFPAHKGFDESEVFEPEGRKLKLGGSLHFKPRKSVELKYAFRFATGSMVHTNDQRFALNNINWHEHSVNAKGENWRITAYTAFESTGNSYSIRRNAELINEAGSREFANRFLVNYADTLRQLSGNFSTALSDSIISMARDSALEHARSAWYVSGTTSFDSIAEIGQNRKGLLEGAGLYSRSNRQGIAGHYRFNMKWMKVDVGANFKRNDPGSDGHLFSDTMDRSYLEYGGWTNFNFDLLKEKLELNAALRVEKTDLTRIQVSPQLGVRYRIKEHAIRASFNTGFRNPTAWELFRINSGINFSVVGNNGGFYNMIPVQRTDSLYSIYYNALQNGIWPSACDEGDEACLRSYLATLIGPSQVDRPEPERVTSVELGYRSVLFKNFYLDLSFYHAWHHNLISYDLYNWFPETDNDPGALATALTDSIWENSIYVPSNSKQVHRTIGGSLLATYHFNENIWANFNYTYTQQLDLHKGQPNIVLNVPSSKVNVGVRVKDLWQHLGFSLNYQWVGNHLVGGTLSQTQIPAYSILDAQISYRIPVIYSTFRIGGSNIINSPIRQIAGGPSLSATLYAAIEFDLNVR